jgi:peptidoglycan biosynthesis protein MviN/MurJ (putative lipid II flippase)
MRSEREMQDISTTDFVNVREIAIVKAVAPNKRSTTKIALAFGCLIGGFAAPLVGLMLLIFHEMFNDDLLNRIGTVLMIVSIPLILVGSIFMDSVDGNDQRNSPSF